MHPYSSLDRLRNGLPDRGRHRLVIGATGMGHLQLAQLDRSLDHDEMP